MAWAYYGIEEWEKAMAAFEKSGKYIIEKQPDADIIAPMMIRKCHEQLAVKEIDIIKQKVAGEHPLHHANVMWPGDAIREKQILQETIPQQEIERTLYWMQLLFKPEILPSYIAKSIVYLPDMERGDDWAIARFNNCQVIDGRCVTVVVHPRPRLDNSIDRDAISNLVISNYKKLLRYDYNRASDMQVPNVQVTVTDFKKDEKGMYGSVNCDPQNREWLRKGTVRWWSNGKIVIFHIDKIIDLPVCKGGPMTLIKDASRYVGGIGDDDPRPFKRFGKDVNELYLKDEFRRVFKEEDQKYKAIPRNKGK